MNKREHTPIVSQAQRRFFFAELARRKKDRASDMSTRTLSGHLKEVEGKKLPEETKKSIGGGMIDTKMNMFVPITKVDEEQRMVYGIATTSSLDRQNEIVDWEATKKALDDYSQWRNIREMHKPSAVGIAPLIEARDEKQEVYIGAKIVDDQAWAKCKEGVYKGFSIGGEVLDRKIEFNKTSGKSVNRVTNYVLNEISVVDRPANPLCVFQTIKRDTTIETVTSPEDPLKNESARLMEKAVTIAKRTLSKVELENLPDEKFGLIKVVSDGDKLIKHRLYPMPDKTHAVNMIRKMTYADDLSIEERGRIHIAAVSVLGKKHVENECPYCLKQKLEGGVGVEKKEAVVEKSLDGKTEVPPQEEPKAKEPVIPTEKAPEEQKPNIKVEEDAPVAGADAVNPIDAVNSRLDRIEQLLTDLLGTEQVENSKEDDAAAVEPVESVESKFGAEDEETSQVDVKSAEDVAKEEADDEEKVVDECVKTEKKDEAPKIEKKEMPKAEVKKVSAVAKAGLMKKVQAILEPIAKENKELKARLEKLEKAPLARKGAVGTEKVKIEKYDKTPEKPQEMVLEKRVIEFSEALRKEIGKASELRKSGRALTADEQAFCQRVAEKMLEEKLTKVA